MSDFFNSDASDSRPVTPWDRVSSPDETGPKPELATAVTAMIDHLVERDRYRVLDDRVLEDLYGGRWVTGDDLLPGVSAYAEAGGDPVKLNFARNAVDFVHTKLCGETPSVKAIARAGGYVTERRADLLSEYVDRLSDRVGLADLLPSAGLHALRTGTSVVKTHAVRGRPDAELVPAEWVFVDQIEARAGEPRSIYERRPMPRRAVIESWVADPDSDDPTAEEAAIRGAPQSSDPLNVGPMTSRSTDVADLIDLYEAWALPEVGPDGAEIPGRHVVCVPGAVLLDEPWTCPRFPHALFHVDPAPVGRGFWAQGLLCQLDEAQAEIDFLLAQVSEQIRLGRLKVFVRSDDKIKDDHLVNSAQGSIVRYSSQSPPEFVTPPSVSQEALQHIQWLVKEIYEVAGMSEQTASSQKPAGINSGRGLLYFHDLQTRRFVDLVRRYGRFVVDVVERLLDRAEELHDPEGGDDSGSPASVGTDLGDGLSWPKVRMDREEYALGLEEVAAVATTYAGRMQRIEQLIAQGKVPQGYWAEYISNPDAYRAEHRAAAQAEHLDWLMSQLEDVDADMPPLSDRLDFALALEILGGEELTLIRKGADQAIVDRYGEFYDRVVARQDEVTKAQAAKRAAMAPPQTGASTAAPDISKAGMPMGGLAPGGQ